MWLNNSFSVYTYISLYHIIDFLRRCSMYRFQGQVSLALLETLSNTLRDLHLSVADTEQYLALSHYLSAATSHLPLLENFSKWFHWVCLVTNVKTSTPMHHADFYLLMYYDNFFFHFFFYRNAYTCMHSGHGVTSATPKRSDFAADNFQSGWRRADLGVSSSFRASAWGETVGL